MIKYEIKTGSSFLNEKARNQRDLVFKRNLKGMKCSKCKVDSLIKFIESDLTHVKAEYNICCTEFETRIKQKLKPNKN